MQRYRDMLDNALIKEVLWLKKERGYTLHDLSKRLDLQVTTIERWLKTGHINRIYAQMVREKLGLK
jgi:hypothetical protein